MQTVLQTEDFRNWLDELKDPRAQVRIAARLRCAESGNLGDWKTLGEGLAEMRVEVGPGYRPYFTRRHSIVIVMLAGGHKSGQRRDIARARRMLRNLELDP